MNASGLVFQSVGNPSRFSNTVSMPALPEEHDRVLGVLVEVGVEDPLVHEPGVVVEEHPAQVVELERREHVGSASSAFARSFP